MKFNIQMVKGQLNLDTIMLQKQLWPLFSVVPQEGDVIIFSCNLASWLKHTTMSQQFLSVFL